MPYVVQTPITVVNKLFIWQVRIVLRPTFTSKPYFICILMIKHKFFHVDLFCFSDKHLYILSTYLHDKKTTV